MTRSKKKKTGKGKGTRNQVLTSNCGTVTDPPTSSYKNSDWKTIKKTTDTVTFKRDDPRLLRMFHPQPHECAIDLFIKDDCAVGITTSIPPLSNFLDEKSKCDAEKWTAFLFALYSGLSNEQLQEAISPGFMDKSILQIDRSYLLSAIQCAWGKQITAETVFESPNEFAARFLSRKYPGDDSVELSVMYVDYFDNYGRRPPDFVILGGDVMDEETAALFPVVN